MLAIAATVVHTLAVGITAVGAHGGVTDFTRKVSGPYEIAFGTSPRTPSPGSSMHVSLRVVEVVSDAAFPDASIRVSGKLSGEGDAELASFDSMDAEQFGEDPVFWDLDLTVDSVGDWVFTVEVQGGPGDGAADFSVRVRDSSPVTGILTIVGLVAFLSVVALAMRTYLRARSTRSGK